MRAQSLNGKQGGSAAVEFALLAPVLLLMFFTIVDLGYMMLVNLTMQHAVREGTRYAIVGLADRDPNPQGTAQDRCDAVVQTIRDKALGLYEAASSSTTFKTINSDGTISPLPGNSCGAANQIIMVSVDSRLSLLTPMVRPFFDDGVYAFATSATMRNEAFK